MKGAFEFLLKFKPVVFEQGRLQFQNVGFLLFLAAIAGVAGLIVLHFYVEKKKFARTGATQRRRLLLLALRLGVLSLILLMLAGPALVVSEINPRENRLAVLVDQSSSMQI